MTLSKDTILENRYRIDELLTQSRRGATYRAFDTNLSRPVAVKEIFLSKSQAVNQFEQRSLILTGLRHRSLPWVIHHFSLEDQQYLVMDFVGGKNLWEFIEDRGQPLQERQALDVIIQICQGVQHLHQQHLPIIHGDIKPQNIKFAPNGQAVLVGFGVVFQNDMAESGPNDPPHAPSGYIAPEQYSAQDVTLASDIYALGATLYAIVTGQTPPHRIGGAQLTSPDFLNPRLSALTAKAIRHAMELNPSHRPLTVLAWQKELEYILKSTADLGPPSQSAAPSRLPPKKAEPALPSLSAEFGLKFWLVDPTGQGYPIGEQPLTIGHSPEADVVLDDPGVSTLHAKICIDGQRCLVTDMGGGQSTLLNDERLGSEPVPVAHGDILTIGPARFHLTNIQPVKVASLKSKSGIKPLSTSDSIVSTSTPHTAPAGPPAKPQLDDGQNVSADVKKNAAPAAPQPKPQRHTILIVVALVLLAGIIAAAYLQFSSTISSTPPPPPPPTNTDAAARVETPALGGQTPAQAEGGAIAATVSVEQTPTSTPESTPTPENTPTSTRLAVASPRPTHTPSQTPTPSPLPPESTPTPAATPIANVISPSATPTASGPTVIPLQSVRTIAQIGAQEVIDVDINPQNPNEVYALVKGDGIYKSSSGGGRPWAKMGIDATSVVAFVIDPANPARFYAPTWNAVLKSSDGGNTWEANSEGLLGNKTVDVVAVDPDNPNNLYAGIGEDLVVSRDGGRTWGSGFGGGLGVAQFHAIVVDPFDPNTIYAGGSAASLYKSVDAGITFSQLPANVGQGAYGLAAHPSQQDVYLVGINSADAGILKLENSLEFRSVSEGLIFGGADSAYNAIVYAPSNPSIVYAGTGYEDNSLAKGIFKSVDGGERWASINNGLSLNPDTGQPYYIKSVAVHATDPNIVFAATGSGLYQSSDGGERWSLR